MARSACLVAWLSFAGGCAQEPPRHAELQPAVYAAALDSLLARDTTGRLIELLGPDTMPRLYVIDRMGADPIRWLVMLEGVRKPPVDSAMVAREELERRKIPRELVMNFVAANLRPDSLHVPVAARAPAYFATLPAGGRARLGPVFRRRWAEPRRPAGRSAYPEPEMILQLSRPGFSRDRQHALVYVETYCGSLCASGTLVRLSRDGERWRVAELLRLWVS